jgi:hypothetical protein
MSPKTLIFEVKTWMDTLKCVQSQATWLSGVFLVKNGFPSEENPFSSKEKSVFPQHLFWNVSLTALHWTEWWSQKVFMFKRVCEVAVPDKTRFFQLGFLLLLYRKALL